MVAATREVEGALPLELLGFDTDNGSEFLNWHLLRYFQERPKGVRFTRSRPYKKHDNGHVEQKNWTHVRQLLGPVASKVLTLGSVGQEWLNKVVDSKRMTPATKRDAEGLGTMVLSMSARPTPTSMGRISTISEVGFASSVGRGPKL